MKPTTLALGAALFTTSIMIASPAFSADINAPTQGAQGNVTFISGGVGEDEKMAMKRAAAGYPLELQFVRKATPRDEFLAGVKVRISDRAGNVLLDAVSEGPFLLANLPAGTYRVEADYSGMVKRQTVDLRGGRHHRSMFVWVAPDTDNATLNSSLGSSPNYQ